MIGYIDMWPDSVSRGAIVGKPFSYTEPIPEGGAYVTTGIVTAVGPSYPPECVRLHIEGEMTRRDA